MEGFYSMKIKPASLTSILIFSLIFVTGLDILAYLIDKEYTITCSHSRFKTKTTTVTLTREKQNLEVNIFYYSGDERDIFSRNIEKINTVHENP